MDFLFVDLIRVQLLSEMLFVLGSFVMQILTYEIMHTETFGICDLLRLEIRFDDIVLT